MAREAMVTRTIITTVAEVLIVDIQSNTTDTVEVTLPRTFSDEKKLLKAVEKVVNTDLVKAVHVNASRQVETLYGMSEQDFINGAKVLDPTTRKALVTE